MWGVTLNGTIIVGGDGEEYTNCSAGTYLEIRRTGTCDGIVNHEYDRDVNPLWPEYVFPNGNKPSASMNLRSSDITTSSVKLVWNKAPDNDKNQIYYVWKGSDVIATVNTLEYQVSGLDNSQSYDFYVQAKDPSGNVSDKSNKLTVTLLTTSVDDNIQDDRIQIYPNPVTQMLNIDRQGNKSARLLIQDIMGRTIIDRIFDTTIRIPRLEFGSAGVYSVFIQSEEDCIAEKIVIQ